MKKIIVAFDNAHYSQGAMQFISLMQEMEPVSVTGVFLPEIEYAALWSKTAGALSGPLFVPLVEESVAAETYAHIHQFEQFCQEHHIRYSIKKDFFDFTLNDLREDTKFADLLVIGSEVFYKEAGTDKMNVYLQETLSHAACPVMLVPEEFNTPQTNILTYDGSEDSIFAIKQFASLFPYFNDMKTLVIYVKKEADAVMPAEKKIKDLVSRHFEQCSFLTLQKDAKKNLTNWLSLQQGGIVTGGSFGRSSLSQLFKRSFIAETITDHQLPVFIAHH